MYIYDHLCCNRKLLFCIIIAIYDDYGKDIDQVPVEKQDSYDGPPDANRGKFTKKSAEAKDYIYNKERQSAHSRLPMIPPVFKQMVQVLPREAPTLLKHSVAKRFRESKVKFDEVMLDLMTEEERAEFASGKLSQQEIGDLERNRIFAECYNRGLSFVSARLLSAQKRRINARIVVIGASNTGLSMLETLLMQPHLDFQMVTLVAPGGVFQDSAQACANPFSENISDDVKRVNSKSSDAALETMDQPLKTTTEIDEHRMRRLMIETRIRVLDTRMKAIDRRQRCVVLDDQWNSLLPYDYLVLCCGLQDDTLNKLDCRSFGYGHASTASKRFQGYPSASELQAAILENHRVDKSMLIPGSPVPSSPVNRESIGVKANDIYSNTHHINDKDVNDDASNIKAATTTVINNGSTEKQSAHTVVRGNGESTDANNSNNTVDKSSSSIISVINGALSIGDPNLKQFLGIGGTFIKSLIWNPLVFTVVYGRTLDVYSIIQGLLVRNVPAVKIILILPPVSTTNEANSEYKSAAVGSKRTSSAEPPQSITLKMIELLKSKSIKIYENFKLTRLHKDSRDRLASVVLEEHGLPLNGERASSSTKNNNNAKILAPNDWNECVESPANLGDAKAGVEQEADKSTDGSTTRNFNGVLQYTGNTTAMGHKECTLSCRILITANAKNVDPDVFKTLDENGLVYDGRLIVDRNFKTTDDAIYAGGSLCEFSRTEFPEVQNRGLLRHDGYNGYEMGKTLAQSILQITKCCHYNYNIMYMRWLRCDQNVRCWWTDRRRWGQG